MVIYFVNSVFSPNTGKYGPEKTLYLDTFHAVIMLIYSLSQLPVRIKITTTTIYFLKKVCIEINPTQNIFR